MRFRFPLQRLDGCVQYRQKEAPPEKRGFTVLGSSFKKAEVAL
jgi:hypothetical protein